MKVLALLIVLLVVAAVASTAGAQAQAEPQATAPGHVIVWQQKCPLDAGGIVIVQFDPRKRANIVSCEILE